MSTLPPSYKILTIFYIRFHSCNGIDPQAEIENNNDTCTVELIEDTMMVNGEPPEGKTHEKVGKMLQIYCYYSDFIL